MKIQFVYSAFLLMTGILFVFSVNAQSGKEYEVKKLRGSGDYKFGCYTDANVVTKELFDKIIADKDCAAQLNFLNIDFEKETLIAFHDGGDCHFHVESQIFRSDEAKKIKVVIKNYYGGCRAGGTYQGWIVLDKIPSDYTVDFFRQLMEQNGSRTREEEFLKSVPPESKTQTMETKEIDMKNCIRLINPEQRIIKNNDEFLQAVRRDASREHCLKTLEPVDFTKNSLIGINLNTGYCGFPSGLKVKTTNDALNRQYLMNITYDDPQWGVCRALSSYDLWRLVPKLPENYTVKFDIKAVINGKNEN